MKFITTILISFLICTTLFAQYKGTSPVGRLIPLPEKEVITHHNPPVISISEPLVQNGGSINVHYSSVAVKGQVMSESDSTKLYMNSVEEILENQGTFSDTVNLLKGRNKVRVEAVDKYGNVSQFNFSVVYTPQVKIFDKTPPTITLLQPGIQNGDTVTVHSSFISITGSVYDASGSINLYMDNKVVSLSNDSLFSNNINLKKGFNTFQYTAVDKYNNSSSLRFTINYMPVIVKPVISLLEPKIANGNEISVEEKMLTISGKVKSANGIKEVLVNYKPATLLNDGEFYINYELSYGINKVTINAIDVNGNSTNKTIIINWSPDITGPVVKIISPPASRGIKIISKTDIITVKGQAIDKSGIFEVTVNDREAALKPNGDFSIDLYLHAGNNPLVVKAVDKKYNVTTDTFIVARKLESLITAGKYIALVIGIDSYQGYWPPLKNAAHDAESVARVLKNDYLFDTVITIINKQATRDNIIHEFENLTQTVGSNDNLLIYYAGHGQFKKDLNRGYWVPVDAKGNSIADFIPNTDIKTFMGGIHSKHTLLISDACFAGDIFRGPPAQSIPFDPNNMERYYREVYSKPARLAITSGGLEEVEDSGKDGHSIFTYYLLKALRNNKNRFLDATQLFNDFKIAVTNNSDQTPLLKVVRDTGDEGGQFIFVKR